MLDNLKGFLICRGLKSPKDLETIDVGNDTWMVDNRLHKFENDEILNRIAGKLYFLDGYVYNIKEICKKYKTNDWACAFAKLLQNEKNPMSLRGSFCGIAETENGYTLFVDQVGNRAIYYYCKDGIVIFSSKFYYIVEILKKSNITLSVNEQAVKYMLQQGFMLDESTFANEIHRVCPGCIVEVDNSSNCKQSNYYMVDNTNVRENMTEQEVVEKIDIYFRQAVKREFDKDLEYGYEHLVDLSGGLDSRMTCWCAHQMGYTKQVNFTYCQSDYLDFKIAQKIALKLKHTFLYMPLDDFAWFREIDEILKKNNGASFYSGITGGNRILSLMNADKFGIEHTGMVGDAILSTFYSDEKYNYGAPNGDENVYSNMIKYQVSDTILKKYKNREQFSIYTRGLLGAQSSYFTRQNYIETSSPFLDVDFLNFVFSIPFKYRKKHYIYLKWIESKYTNAADFGWEKWFGIQPKLSKINHKRIATTWNKYTNIFKVKMGIDRKKGMNPIDYWLSKDDNMRKWISDYYVENIKYADTISSIKDDIVKLFKEGGATEKAQVLTVLTMIKYVVE